VSFSKDKGKMLENNIFLHLKRNSKEVFYFNEEKECDFIVKEKNKITHLIQACYNLNEENKDREINGILKSMNKFNLKKGLILTLNQKDEFQIENKQIIVMPVWKWLLKKP